MPSLIFVHGTGVREPEYTTTITHIKHLLQSKRPDINVLPCSWGEAVGAQFHYGGSSVPFFDTTMSIGDEELSDDEALRALWDLLYHDPFYELRILERSMPSENEPIPGQVPLGEMLDQHIHQLSSSPSIQTLSASPAIAQHFATAVATLTKHPSYRHITDAVHTDIGIEPVIARALVALIISEIEQASDWDPLLTDAERRDQAVTTLSTALTTSAAMGIIDPLKPLGWLASRGLSWFAERRRGRFTKKTVGMMGDILRYQGRGAAIREYIRSCILSAAQTESNIIVLAHSLGGIACVDLLVAEDLPVTQLITVGSQAPLFYEINALYSLPYDQPLPTSFPRWLNIYDRQDFLSYIAAGVFNKTNQSLQVEDVAVDNRQPFPRSHSSYWTNPSVWKAILGRVP